MDVLIGVQQASPYSKDAKDEGELIDGERIVVKTPPRTWRKIII